MRQTRSASRPSVSPSNWTPENHTSKLAGARVRTRSAASSHSLWISCVSMPLVLLVSPNPEKERLPTATPQPCFPQPDPTRSPQSVEKQWPIPYGVGPPNRPFPQNCFLPASGSVCLRPLQVHVRLVVGHRRHFLRPLTRAARCQNWSRTLQCPTRETRAASISCVAASTENLDRKLNWRKRL